MVAQSDLARVTALNAELGRINQAIVLFDRGATITDLTVEGTTAPWQLPTIAGATRVTISTLGMTYPPAMVEAIKGFLNVRAQEIYDELKVLGVTEVTPPSPPGLDRRYDPHFPDDGEIERARHPPPSEYNVPEISALRVGDDRLASSG